MWKNEEKVVRFLEDVAFQNTLRRPNSKFI